MIDIEDLKNIVKEKTMRNQWAIGLDVVIVILFLWSCVLITDVWVWMLRGF